ncbi:MAG: GNAT family N-acetyltransferase [Verrucomicrobia bacterium]|nr:MAG: GNAT family N-acetyltransferase [Verrucomicrobiota bacterium]
MNESTMIRHLPTLATERLNLRPFTLADAEFVRELAGAPAIYATTQNIPHPYEEGMAEKWIATHASNFYEGRGVQLAITLKEAGRLVGAIALTARPAHKRAELGYWIGLPYWGNGYCTEAAREVIRYGFETLGLHKINAHHLSENPASGRVMEKAGMSREGIMVDHFLKDGAFRSVTAYAILNHAPL